MLLKRFRTWFLIGASLLGINGLAQAQGPAEAPLSNYIPFRPSEVADEHNYRPFERFNSSNYGRGNTANEGYFFQYDRLIWAMTGPKKTDIGNETAQGILLNAGGGFFNFNTLDTGFIETDWDWGNRYELGYVNKQSGWLVSVAHLHEFGSSISAANVTTAFNDPFFTQTNFVDLDGDGRDDDLDGNGVFGDTRPFNTDLLQPNPAPPPDFIPGADGILDTYVGPDFNDLTGFPVIHETLVAVNTTRLWTIELMHVNRWDPLHYGGTFEWLTGLRYLSITDDFGVLGQGTDAFNNIFSRFAFDTRIHNNLVGPQIGMRWYNQRGRWNFGAEARFTAAANFQQARMNGSIVALSPILDGLAAGITNDFNDSKTTTTFSPLGEFRLDTAYQVTKTISLRMGYTGLIAGGVGRASRRTGYDLPSMRIRDDRVNEAFIVNGFNFGVEINR